MGFLGSIFKVVTGPLGVLENWANEPLKRWEHKRQEASKDRDVERKIREATGVEEAKARMQKELARNQAELNIRMQEEADKINAAVHRRNEDAKNQAMAREIRLQESKARIQEDLAKNQADLEIRMQTEITRVNAETEQWVKDKEFERMKNVTDAISNYQERLMELNLRTVRAIGEMDIELRSKAQALILEKTREYRAIQDQATENAIAEFERIQEKFSSNERILNIMISNSERKLASIIDATSNFLAELSLDIQNMNKNIDRLIQDGHAHTLRQLESFNKSTQFVTNRIDVDTVQDIEFKELPNG